MSQVKRAYREIVSPRGQTMTEYAMILATIAVVLFAFLQNAGAIVSALIDRVVPLL
jgi:Flp pilus assembly pilin Flp